MSTIELRDDQWSKVLEFLCSCSDLYVGEEGDCRRYVEAILWMARSGAPWRLLPER
ncbi:MAG: transposase, partial [Chloroflexi bacterium]|nr:transposase [Chloroflexota bacterium]